MLFYLSQYVVEIKLNYAGHYACTLYAYGDVRCKQCKGKGWIDDKKCPACGGAGVVRDVIPEPPALTRAELDSLEAQYLVLWRRYGTVDVQSVRDYWQPTTQNAK